MNKKTPIEIPYLSEDELNQSVNYIVNMSLNKTSVLKDFFTMVKTVPLSLVFNSKLTFVFIGFIYFMAALYVDMTNLYKDPRHYYQFISILAPTAYIIGLLDIVNSKEHNVIHLEMSTKYNFQQLTAYKIVILFVYSILMNFAIFYTISMIISNHRIYQTTVTLFDAILLMFSILFLISSISLFILLRFTNRHLPFVMLTLWYLFIIICAFMVPSFFEEGMLLHVAQILAVVIGAVLHFEQVRFIFSKKFLEKGVN